MSALAAILVPYPASAQSYGFGVVIGPGTYEDLDCKEDSCRFTLTETDEGEPLALQYDSGSCGLKGRMDRAANVEALKSLEAKGALGGTISETNFTPQPGTFDIYLVETGQGNRYVVRMNVDCPMQFSGEFKKRPE